MDMKKAILLGLIPASFVCTAFLTNVKADEQELITSDYTVTIPSETTISNSTNEGTLSFNGTVNPYNKFDVAITSKNDFNLKCGTDSFAYTLDKDSFSYSTITDSTSFDETLKLSTQGKKKYAGRYSDQLVFSFTDTTRNFLDINGWLDGSEFDDGDMSSIATCDIYINGVQVADDVSDWWNEYDEGTTYEVKDIKVKSDDYSYTGLQSGSLTGTVSGRTNVNLNFVTNKTVTLDANGGKFSDGTTTQTLKLAPNSEYGDLPEPTQSGYDFDGWYIKDTNTKVTSTDTIGTENVSLEAKWLVIPVLQTGSDFNKNIPSETTSIVFTNETAPASAKLTDVSANSDKSVVAWLGVGTDDSTTWYVSSQRTDGKIRFNSDSSSMFLDDEENGTDHYYLEQIDFGKSVIDTSNVTNMNSMFSNCVNLNSLDLSSFDTSNVVDMQKMFCAESSTMKLTSINLSNFKTNHVTNMKDMFMGCTNLLSLDLSNFNTSNITTMSGMFAGCMNLEILDLTGFNTSKVTDMSSMFIYCENLTTLDLSTFDTSNVTSMDNMFSECSKLTTVYVRSETDKTNLSGASNTPAKVTFVVKSEDETISNDSNIVSASLNTDSSEKVDDTEETDETSNTNADSTESNEKEDEALDE